MSNIDYRKWDHIEVSDDEDETHPNIDTPSLFRWRHQVRLERDAEFREKKSKVNKEFKNAATSVESLKQKIETSKQSADSEENIQMLTEELKNAEVTLKEAEVKKTDLAKEEKKRPLNIDTICREGKSKTIINKVSEPEEPLDEDSSFERLQAFVKENESKIKKFGMYQRPDDTMKYLLENTQLVCEETANHLVLWCIDLALEEKEDLFLHVSHQTIVMQFLLELAKSLKADPRSCIRPFFSKFRGASGQVPEYMAAFNDELDSFRDRIRKRAEERVKEAMKKYEEEECQKRLGPGGLDPVEVFESLPSELKLCFEKKDKEMLTEQLSNMDPADAEYHLNRCIQSGLWVPDAEAENVAENDEPVYETAGDVHQD